MTYLRKNWWFYTVVTVALIVGWLAPTKAQDPHTPPSPERRVQVQQSPKWIVFLEPQVADGDEIGTAYVTAFAASLDAVASIQAFVIPHTSDSNDAFVIRVMTTPSCKGKTIVHVFLLRHVKNQEFDIYLGGFSGAVEEGDELGAAEQSNVTMARMVMQYVAHEAARSQVQ